MAGAGGARKVPGTTEDSIVPRLDSWVAELFTDDHLDDTCARLAAAAQPDSGQEAQERKIRERIQKLDQELDNYRTIVRTEPEAASADEAKVYAKLGIDSPTAKTAGSSNPGRV